MPVYQLDPSIRGLKVSMQFGGISNQPEDNFVTTHRLGPLTVDRRIKGILEPTHSVEFKTNNSVFTSDKGARVAKLTNGVVEVFDWWEEFSSLHFGPKREVPLEWIKSDPELRKVLYYSPERR